MPEGKVYRVLYIYRRLTEGEPVNRDEIARRFGVDMRTLQRDIADIREFVERSAPLPKEYATIVFDRRSGCYRIVRGTLDI